MSELVLYTSEDGELSPESTVKESLTVQTEGEQEVQRIIHLGAIAADAEYLKAIEDLDEDLKRKGGKT